MKSLTPSGVINHHKLSGNDGILLTRLNFSLEGEWRGCLGGFVSVQAVSHTTSVRRWLHDRNPLKMHTGMRHATRTPRKYHILPASIYKLDGVAPLKPHPPPISSTTMSK
jgi:hypothetical protein